MSVETIIREGDKDCFDTIGLVWPAEKPKKLESTRSEYGWVEFSGWGWKKDEITAVLKSLRR